MIELFSSLYESYFSPVQYNILIAGQGEAGKTTFFEQVKFLYNLPLQREAERKLSDSNLDISTQVNQEIVHRVASSEEVGATEGSRLAAITPAATGNAYLIPASREFLDGRYIRPTIGLNYATVQHRPAARISLNVVHAPVTPLVESLPPPPSLVKSGSDAVQHSLFPCQLNMWDVGGQRFLRTLWQNYYSTCHGVIFIVDTTLHLSSNERANMVASPVSNTEELESATRARYDESYGILRKLLHEKKLDGVPFLVLGNKADVEGHLTEAQLQDALRLDDIASEAVFYATNGDAPSHDQASDEGHSPIEDAGCSDSLEKVGDGEEPSEVALESSLDATDPGADSTQQEKESIPKETLTPASCPAKPLLRQNMIPHGGFGSKTLKVMNISALSGYNVVYAMDWLVQHLQASAREVPARS